MQVVPKSLVGDAYEFTGPDSNIPGVERYEVSGGHVYMLQSANKGYARVEKGHFVVLTTQGALLLTPTEFAFAEDPFVRIEGGYTPNPSHEEGWVQNLLRMCGEDPDREGLKETPRRFISALKEYTAGYHQDPKDVLKVFEDGAEGYDELVVLKKIPFSSLCEHHLAPFYGSVSLGYIPDGKVVGLSKLARVVDIFARRLQVQERMTVQIARALEENLKPRGVGVVVEARHLCMECRGVKKTGSVTVTSALFGAIREQARSEFLRLIDR